MKILLKWRWSKAQPLKQGEVKQSVWGLPLKKDTRLRDPAGVGGLQEWEPTCCKLGSWDLSSCCMAIRHAVVWMYRLALYSQIMELCCIVNFFG